MANLHDVKEIKRLLNKAYGKDSSPEDAVMARLIAYSFYGKFGASHPNIVPRETTEKGDDNMEQRKFKVGDKVKYDNGTGNVYYGEVLADVHEGYVPVGLHGFEGHMLQAVFPELRKTIIEKGYEKPVLA